MGILQSIGLLVWLVLMLLYFMRDTESFEKLTKFQHHSSELNSAEAEKASKLGHAMTVERSEELAYLIISATSSFFFVVTFFMGYFGK